MSVRDLQISFPPSSAENRLVDTIKLSGERSYGLGDEWRPFTATVEIDWNVIAEHYCKGGRQTLGYRAITSDTRLYDPKEVHID